MVLDDATPAPWRVSGDGPVRSPLVSAAAELASRLLEPTPERLRHTRGVAGQAQFLSTALDSELGTTLVAAAWLHDIGYARRLRETGFHPIDGARYLQRSGWPPEIYDLVAHHSGARFLAAAIGLEDALRRYPFLIGPLSDALTVADQSTGPHGEHTTVERRLADQLRRHGPNSPYAQAYQQRGPYVRSCAFRIAALFQQTAWSRLRASGSARGALGEEDLPRHRNADPVGSVALSPFGS
jgi:hypothetical protein